LIYLVMAAFCLYIWGWKVLDDFIFGLANDYLCFLIWGLLGKKYLPFSRQPNTRQQSGRFIIVILQMAIISALVGIHYVVIRYPLALYIAFPFIILLCWLLQQRMRKLSWAQITI